MDEKEHFVSLIVFYGNSALMTRTHCKKHPEILATSSCKVCKNGCCDDCMGPAGVCTSCWFKIVAVLFVIMMVGASIVWSFWGW